MLAVYLQESKMTNLLAVPKKIMSVLVPVKFCQAKWAHLLSRGSAIAW